MGHPVVLKHIWFERKGHQICGWCTQQWRQHQTLLTCLRRQESSCNYWFWHSPQSESIHWRSWCGTMTKAVFSNRIIKGAFSGTKDCKGKIWSTDILSMYISRQTMYGECPVLWVLWLIMMMDLGFISEVAATTALPQNPSCIQDHVGYNFTAEARIELKYPEYLQSSSSKCERLCSSKSECRYWTYTQNQCEIYKTETATIVARDHVSGSRNCPHVSNSVFLL